MSDRELLLEIHQMLCKVCGYIDKVESPEYVKTSEEREFAINVAADLYVEQLERLRNNKP
jgi:hypothetical protein